MAFGPVAASAILEQWLDSSVTLSLHTGGPGLSGTANEATGASYARVPVEWEVEGTAATNSTLVSFGPLASGTYSHYGIWADNSFWGYGTLETPLVIRTGGVIEFKVGSVRVGLDETEPVPVPGDLSIVPANLRTTWDPGIPGGIPTERQVYTTLTGLTTNGTGDDTTAINNAIAAAGAAYTSTGIIQEVVLPVGTIRITDTLSIRSSGVVLRGQGMNQTKIRCDSNWEDPVAIRVAYNNWFDPTPAKGPWRLTADAAKGEYEITLSNSDAANIQVGDVLCIDEEDDTFVTERYVGGYMYFKRPATGGDTFGPPLRPGGGLRSVTSMIEITGKTAGASNTTFTLRDPLHMNFRTAQFAEVWHLATERTPSRQNMEGVHYVGIEDLYVTGGGVTLQRTAYSWIKGVEVDGNPGTPNIGTYTNPGGCGGMSVQIYGSYRAEIRGCYVHHKRNIVQGGGGYLITLYSYTSESLIEDNIVVFGNKGIMGVVAGGGNVIAYNYVDGVATFQPQWQEGAINLNHGTFPHNFLVEGNDTANLTADSTHGISGYHVFFRNYSRGVNAEKINGTYPYNEGLFDGQFRRAAGADGYSLDTGWIGNVLHADPASGASAVYQADHANSQMSNGVVWRIGQAFGGAGDVPDSGQALANTYRHLNWDSVNQAIADEDIKNTASLPNSLYHSSKPAFFGGMAWPPVNPYGSTSQERFSGIPAKVRYDEILGN